MRTSVTIAGGLLLTVMAVVGCASQPIAEKFVADQNAQPGAKESGCNLWNSGNVTPDDVAFLDYEYWKMKASVDNEVQTALDRFSEIELKSAIIAWHERNC